MRTITTQTKIRTRRPRYLDELMAETIIYGGCSATRAEVYDDCISRGLHFLAADRFAILPPAVKPDSVGHRPTLAQVRAWELARSEKCR